MNYLEQTCRAVVIAGALFVTMSSLTRGQDRGVGVERTSRPSEEIEGRRFALVIGIDGYTRFAALRYCVKDATGLAGILRTECGYAAGDVFLLVDGERDFKDQPTRANILATIRRVAGLCGRHDVLLVYFSGHGTNQGERGFLVPIDAQNDAPESLVGLSEVRGILRDSAASWRVLILDACHSGTEKDSASAAMNAAFEKSLRSEGDGILTLASCKASEKSRESDAYGHGLFTHWLIKGLAGSADGEDIGNRDGFVESDELFKFVYERVRHDAVREFGADQNPFWTGSGTGRLVLARTAGHGPTSEPAGEVRNEPPEESIVSVSEDGRRLIARVKSTATSSSIRDLAAAKRELRVKAELALKQALQARGVEDPMPQIRQWTESVEVVGMNQLEGCYTVRLSS